MSIFSGSPADRQPFGRGFLAQLGDGYHVETAEGVGNVIGQTLALDPN